MDASVLQRQLKKALEIIRAGAETRFYKSIITCCYAFEMTLLPIITLVMTYYNHHYYIHYYIHFYLLLRNNGSIITYYYGAIITYYYVIMDPLLPIITRSLMGNNGSIITY